MASLSPASDPLATDGLIGMNSDEYLPKQTPELSLSRRGRDVSSPVTCPMALCTYTLEAQVGQEGRGDTDQTPGCHGRPVRAILILAQPQQLLGVFQPLLNGPAFVLHLDNVRGGALRIVGYQPEDRASGPFPREDHVQGPDLADLQQAGTDNAVPGAAMRFCDHQGLSAPAPKLIPPITAGFEFPARLQRAPIVLEGRGKVEALFPAGLYHRGPQIIGITRHDDLDAGGGIELPNEVGGQLDRFLEGDTHRGTRFLLDIQPDAPGDHVLPEEQNATDILVPLEIGVGRGVLHLGDRVHRPAPFGLLRVVNDQVESFSRARTEGAQQCLGLLAEGCLGLPVLDQEEVVEAGPVARRIQILIYVGDIPLKVPLQGLKKLVKRGGSPYDTEHEVILLEPMVIGRLHTLPSHGPRMASPLAAVKTFPRFPPKKSGKMRNLFPLCISWYTPHGFF